VCCNKSHDAQGIRIVEIDFLRAGSKKYFEKEAGLLVSLLDNQATIVEQRDSLCRALCAQEQGSKCEAGERFSKCYADVYLLHFRPGCIAPSEFFHVLDERLKWGAAKEKEIKRLVFWDLAQLEYRFPLLAADAMFLPGLMDYLKHTRKVCSVFMGASNAHFSKAASAMADNVVFCWEDYKSSRPKEKGIAYYVDRIEGKPEKGDLRFLTTSFELQPVKESELLYAFRMIEEIRNIQGLPVHLAAECR